MPLVSIVIPCYNQAKFLDQAIRSALGQTHRDLEVVVINDGSTDNTPEVAGRFLSDPRLRLMNQRNAGLPAARNSGIRESRGEFINFLDSDDWLAEDMIETLVSTLIENPEASFSYCDLQITDSNGTPLNTFSVGTAREVVNGDIFGSLVIGGYFPPLAVLLRRSVLDEVGWFDEDLGGHADYDLWLRASAKGHRALYVDRKLAYYRAHDGSMSCNWQHMSSTREAAFGKIARLCPERFAQAVNQMIEDREDMYRAHTWLDNQYKELKKWVDELQKGKDWLEGQWRMLQECVKNRDAMIDAMRKELQELKHQRRERIAK